jgi:hypothetical protein
MLPQVLRSMLEQRYAQNNQYYFGRRHYRQHQAS